MGERYALYIEDSPAKRRWYRKYAREISEMQGQEYDYKAADEAYEELTWDKYGCFWVPVHYGRKTVGFFTMCTTPHCPPNVDYLLRDAYVRPQYRRLGAMKKALLRWLMLYPGVYEVLVLNENKPAYLCWCNLFEEAGYTVIESYKHQERSGAQSTLFRFKPKEESQLHLCWHPRRENLYMEYCKEMDTMQGLEFNQQRCETNLLEFLDERKNVWIPIVHNNQEVGFICMCAPPCCHPDADWFLREAYVRPEFRRQGLMRRTLLQRLKSHPGRYCLFIAENNTPAQKCWHNIFQHAKYVPIELRSLEEFEDVPMKLYGFEPKEE